MHMRLGLANTATSATNAMPAPTLHYHPLSSYCDKVLIAADVLGVAIDRQLLDFADPAARAACLAMWPIGKMPLLVDRARPYFSFYPGRAGLALAAPGLASRALHVRNWRAAEPRDSGQGRDSVPCAGRSIRRSVRPAPAHMPTNATQAVSAKMEPPVMPAPTAQPPASIAPKPISTAPTM